MPKCIDPKALAALGEFCVAHLAWQQKPDGTTFCNFSVATAALFFGCDELHDIHGNPLTANRIARQLDESPNFVTPANWFDAQERANEGQFVVIYNDGEPHGHACYVVPGRMIQSGNYGGPVPRVANVGPAKYTGIVGLGYAISPGRKPRMKAYNPK